jgi:hypothetical protein
VVRGNYTNVASVTPPLQLRKVRSVEAIGLLLG